VTVDSGEFLNEVRIVNLDSRTEKCGNHQQNNVIPELNGSWNVCSASCPSNPSVAGERMNTMRTRKDTCVHCNGTGYQTCFVCGGTGKQDDILTFPQQRRARPRLNCTSCNGKGRKSCISCGGKGYTQVFEFDFENWSAPSSVLGTHLPSTRVSTETQETQRAREEHPTIQLSLSAGIVWSVFFLALGFGIALWLTSVGALRLSKDDALTRSIDATVVALDKLSQENVSLGQKVAVLEQEIRDLQAVRVSLESQLRDNQVEQLKWATIGALIGFALQAIVFEQKRISDWIRRLSSPSAHKSQDSSSSTITSTDEKL